MVPIRESANSEDASAKYFTVISTVCHDLALLVEQAIAAGGVPIVLGGDHSIAMGTLTGLTRAYGSPPGLVWVDAHADINSPASSATGNVHGMPLYFTLTNGFADPSRTVQIGLRDVDADEKRILRDFGVKTFTMTDVDKRGMMHVMDDARAIAGADQHPIHVSFDMDALDPSEAPGTGTPVRGGLSYREAHLVMEMLADSGQLGSIEMVEINPIFDHPQSDGVARGRPDLLGPRQIYTVVSKRDFYSLIVAAPAQETPPPHTAGSQLASASIERMRVSICGSIGGLNSMVCVRPSSPTVTSSVTCTFNAPSCLSTPGSSTGTGCSAPNGR